jgi:4a-hydroxytetrahydrobiopterin dehydratase
MPDLKRSRCAPCEGKTRPLERAEAEALLRQTPGWELNADPDDSEATEISRSFGFNDFYETMAFVNAVAWIANREDHHPDLEVGYKRCRVRYSTHAVHGLSNNDFICAAKINDLIGE